MGDGRWDGWAVAVWCLIGPEGAVGGGPLGCWGAGVGRLGEGGAL